MGNISKYCDSAQHHLASGSSKDMAQIPRMLPSDPYEVAAPDHYKPSKYRAEDGQHYSESYYNPGESSGMRSTISKANRVGVERSGHQQQMEVPLPPRDSLVKTQTEPGTLIGSQSNWRGNNKGVG